MPVGTIRDSLLACIDGLRGLPPTFGLRRFSVTIRRRVWSNVQAGEGTATNYDIGITPAPKVVDITSQILTNTEAEYKAANSDVVTGPFYKISGITPQYYNQAGIRLGGYTAEQLRLWPNRDTGAVENLVALAGDDGYLRECVQVTFNQGRAFGYSMIVKEIDRPRSVLTGLLIQPPNPTIVHGNTQQLTSIGTYSGGATSFLTTLTAWSTSNAAVATVDIYGNVTGVAAGTATITGVCLGQTATLSVTVT